MYSILHFLENSFLTVIFVFLISFSVVPYMALRPNIDNFTKTDKPKVFGSYSFKISDFTFTKSENNVVLFEGKINPFSQKQIVIPKELLYRQVFLKNQSTSLKVFVEGDNLFIINNSQVPLSIEGILY